MSNYAWKCNRCETSAEDSSRTGVELFAEHHVRTVHPLFAGVIKPRPRRRNRRASRPVSGLPSRRLTRAGISEGNQP